MDSFLQHLDELSKRGAITPQPWGDVTQERNIDDVYAAAADAALIIEKKFIRVLQSVKRIVKQPKWLHRIKTMKSFVNKAYERGLVKDTSAMTDILAGAVLTNTQGEAEKAANYIAKHNTLLEYEILDKNGRTTTHFSGNEDRKGTTSFKQYGKEEAEYGYHGSYHLLIKIDKVVTEIQIMTKRLWAYKEEGHKFYDKYRSAKDFKVMSPEAEMKRVDKALSKKIYHVANTTPHRNKIKGARDHKKRY